MLNLGLTGGIGSGKSAVSTVLQDLGATVVDADKIAREVVEPGTDGLEQVAAEFGQSVLRADGSLDRPALAQIVFNEEAARLRLNAIVHPLVRGRSEQLVREAGEHAIIVHDIPLLAEGTMAPSFHLVVVVSTPVSVRLERLTGQRGMDRKDAMARIEAQATDEQRLAIADVVLDNSGTPQELRTQIERHWTERIAPYGQALARGESAQQRLTPRDGARTRDHARLTWALAQVDASVTEVRESTAVVSGVNSSVRPALARAGWFGDAELRPADPAGTLSVRIAAESPGPVAR